MKKTLLLLLVLLMLDNVLHAQVWRNNRKEVFFGLGATNFLGDLGGANVPGNSGLKDLNMEASRPVLNIGYLHKWKKWFAFQHDLYYGTLYGDDAFSAQRSLTRQFNFKSPIVEFSTKMQVYYSFEKGGRNYNMKDIRGERNHQLTPYLYAGVGLFWFNPKGRYVDGKWYSLRPLATEGQGLYPTRKKYSLLQPCIPIGGGIKFLMNQNWLIAVDLGMRKTFTDYIDDVSLSYVNTDLLYSHVGPMSAYFSDPTGSYEPGEPRGGAFKKDVYMFAMITFRRIIPEPRRYFTTGRGKYKSKRR